MRGTSELEEKFTSAQAAVILGLAAGGKKVTSRTVDKIIQDKFVPDPFIRRQKAWRVVTLRGLYVVAMEVQLRHDLPVKNLRRQIYQTWARHDGDDCEFQVSDWLNVSVETIVTSMHSALERYRRLMRLVDVDPDVQRGEPILRGTRVTVGPIAAMLDGGTPKEEILRHYPSLSPEMIEAASLYSRAFPRRGRPPLPGKWVEAERVKIADLKAM